MPKKFKGENSKASEAKARKEAARLEAAEKKKKEIEDEFWRDDDKHVAKKQNRKEEREKKRIEQLDKKKELQKMLEEEESTLVVAAPEPSAKVTRAQIASHRAQVEAAASAGGKKQARELSHDDTPLEENINRIEPVEGEARSIVEAISVLSTKDDEFDKHPERRAKAAYAAFEEKNLPILKSENPNMRLSQLKQMLRKDWMKSPENPLNQKLRAYNAKK
ncbi:hypothetical protein CAPTEDRAFT_224864 [Capitella teleta]|uniref:Coiled-coil domain-containing protein n=1 Tax=Capitella teleta TaxID=283909 RepID=R7V7D2_CAPTE|nr:hypothetical protein CAPTEDRAFT_224864 [Capitella teleta]|eukprot:ELU14377.1 hypothetical protein CAPTEDRAFT_224864 [Capitella teleta]